MDDIHGENLTLKEIYNSVLKALKDLNKLKVLEEKGKIKVQDTESINPIFIEILDEKVESEVINNPIVDVDEVE